MNHLLAHIIPAKESVQSREMTDIIKENAKISADQLVSRSPIISEALHNETIKIVPAYYHLDTGYIDFLQ